MNFAVNMGNWDLWLQSTNCCFC